MNKMVFGVLTIIAFFVFIVMPWAFDAAVAEGKRNNPNPPPSQRERIEILEKKVERLERELNIGPIDKRVRFLERQFNVEPIKNDGFAPINEQSELRFK